MGATPSSALALAVVPYGPGQFQEAELGDLLEGAVQVGGNFIGHITQQTVKFATCLTLKD
jgi:hypothetical protein